jgi:hypothetical protein
VDKGTKASLAFFAVAAGGGAYMWWKGKQMARPPLTGSLTVQTPNGPVVVRPITVNISSSITDELTPEEKLRLGSKFALQKIPSKIKFNAIYRLKDKINLDYMRSDGLLGKIAAQHYNSEHSRLFYMTRCGASSWDDDTPCWKARNNKRVSKDAISRMLEDPESYCVAINNKHYASRWEPNNKLEQRAPYKDMYRRRYGCETIFSNWSAPVWFDWVNRSFPYASKPSRQADGPVAKIYEINFFLGTADFGTYMTHALGANIFSGHTNPSIYDKGSDTFDLYTKVEPAKRYKLHTLPWREFKGVSYADRMHATYKIKPILGTMGRTANAVKEYYTQGYYLVRAVLDILCARGEYAGDFPGFAEHCTWWMIPQPTKDLLAKNSDLSSIGGGVTGLADTVSAALVKYVMAITPKPGTIAPWEDTGPLWLWPSSTGYMRPQSSLGLVPNRSTPKYDQTGQMVLGLTSSICSSVAGSLGFAVNIFAEALNFLISVASKWLSEGVAMVISLLEKVLDSKAFEIAKKILSEVCSMASDISTFINAEGMVGAIVTGSNLPTTLGSYLGALTDGVTGDYLNRLQSEAQAQIDVLRRNWDWADDLIGETASMGNKINGALGRLG